MLSIHQGLVLPSRGRGSMTVKRGHAEDNGAKGMDSAMGGPTGGNGVGGETQAGDTGGERPPGWPHTRPGCPALRPVLRADGPVVCGAAPGCSLSVLPACPGPRVPGLTPATCGLSSCRSRGLGLLLLRSGPVLCCSVLFLCVCAAVCRGWGVRAAWPSARHVRPAAC